MASMVSGADPEGCEDVKKMRSTPVSPHGTQQIGKTRRQTYRDHNELTFWPSSVISRTPWRTKPVTSSTISLEGATFFATAHVRHDAIGAEIIAACHDGHPCVILGLAMPRHAHGIRILMLIGADMTLTIKERLGNELGHMCDGMRAKDDIDVIDVGEQALSITLRDTAAHGNHTLCPKAKAAGFCRNCTDRTGEYRRPHAHSMS